MLFVEAPRDRDEMRPRDRRASAARTPLMANMVEGGKTPVDERPSDLEALGFSLVIFPGGVVRALAHAQALLREPARARQQHDPFRDRMFDFDGLNDADRHAGAAGARRRTATERRTQLMRRSIPVTLAVLKGRLEQIADEMDATLFRSAFNPIIAEAHDACHGLYDADDRRHAGAGQVGPADLRRRHGLRGQGGDRQGRATQGGSRDGDVCHLQRPL